VYRGLATATFVVARKHTVARWLGHSENVAFKYYLRTTDEEFRRAAGLTQPEAIGEALLCQTEANCEADAVRPEVTAKDKRPKIRGNKTLNGVYAAANTPAKAPPVGLETTAGALNPRCDRIEDVSQVFSGTRSTSPRRGHRIAYGLGLHGQ
jgi:hypothetical protein